MSKKIQLSPNMSVEQFQNGYWYANELKSFAKRLGVSPVSRLRKDQLEKVILHFLATGKLDNAVNKNSADRMHDIVAVELTLTTEVKNYRNNKTTKSFILSEAKKLCPELPTKSGVWYWINRWREEKIEKSLKITYGDLIEQFVKLSCQRERLPQIPSARFNNFITDFLNANEGTRSDAMEAWERLKALDVPKTYAAWKNLST